MSWATKLIILSYHLITTANITVLKRCSNVYTITTVASGTMLPSYERAFMLSATCNALDGIWRLQLLCHALSLADATGQNVSLRVV